MELAKGEDALKGFHLLIVFASILFFFTALASAEPRFDAYFGMGTMRDGSTHQAIDFLGTGHPLPTPSLDGVFGTFGGAFMLNPSVGVGAELSLRFAQGDYAGLGYRPIFYDFNGIWTPHITKRFMPEFQGGFGGVNLRFYNPSATYFDYNTGQYSDFAGSSNHLQLHAGAGLRIYVKPHIFIRPQVDYHWVRNLTTEFNSNSVAAYSIAIGFSSGD